MKKIFSLSLMAVALLISGNAKAAVSTEADLRNAIENAAAGATVNVTLGSDITISGSPIQIWGKFNDPQKTINLDLGGFTLSREEGTGTVLELFKGELNISNGTVKTSISSGQPVVVHGVYDEKEDWAVLNVAKNARIVSSQYNAIVIMEFRNISYYANIDVAFAGTFLEDYRTTPSAEMAAYYYQKNKDTLMVNGVVDHSNSTSRCPLTTAPSNNPSGNIVPSGLDYTSSVWKYGTEEKSAALSKAGYRHYVTGAAFAKANGVKINIDGYVYGHKYGIKVNGTLKNKSTYQPQITVGPDAEIACASTTQDDLKGKESVAIYCSGQATWYIQGYVHGNVGMNIKSGEVTLDGAVVEATGTEYETPTWTKGSGCEGGSGCAIIVESRSNYGGEQTLTIKGDTRVTASAGLGIYEGTTTGEGDKVSGINIEGGTIEGGDAGAMIISQQVADTKTEIKIANVDGEVKVTGTDKGLEDIISGDSHLVDVDGTAVIMVGDPAEEVTDINEAATNASIKLTTTQTLNSDKTLTLLELEGCTLTISDGKTLIVGRMMMDADAKIIVPADGALIVTGNDGVYAKNEDNIVLMAAGDQLAKFIFKYNVSANKQPWATVYYNSTCKQLAEGSTAHSWNRLVSPFESFTYRTFNKSEVEYYGSKLTINWKVWDPANGWVSCELDEGNNPIVGAFDGIALSNNSKNGDAIYEFKGKLQGAKEGRLEIKKGWNYFGNSFTAPMDLQVLVQQIPATGLKLWNAAEQRYEDANIDLIMDGMADEVLELPAMQTFMFKADEDQTITLDYKALIWDYYEANK